MGSSRSSGPFSGPKLVRHTEKKDPTRDPSLENSFMFALISFLDEHTATTGTPKTC